MSRWPHERALAVAQELVDLLEPSCERIAIAGSIRRGALRVKDIELVVEPRPERDLFGDVAHGSTLLEDALDLLERDHVIERRHFAPRVTRWGERYKAAVHCTSEIPIDLFIVRPPAQWGAILAIRTGPHELSQRLVTACRDRGLRCINGRLVDDDGSELATPEEHDFFAACGMSWIEPESRGDRT